MTGREPSPEDVARLALAKAAAWDRLAGALGRDLGLEWSDAMPLDWVVDELVGKMRARLLLADAHENGRKPWLRRRGW